MLNKLCSIPGRVRAFLSALVNRVQTFRLRRPTLPDSDEFVIKVIRTTYTAIFNFVKSVVDHVETVIVIVLATIGMTALLAQSEWLMTVAMPLWINPAAVLPVTSAAIVWGLIRSASWHRNWRLRTTLS